MRVLSTMRKLMGYFAKACLIFLLVLKREMALSRTRMTSCIALLRDPAQTDAHATYFFRRAVKWGLRPEAMSKVGRPKE